MKQPANIRQRPKTKIVCTLGPGPEDEDKPAYSNPSYSKEAIEKLILAGMSVARLNFSHDGADTHGETFQNVREVSGALGIPVGIMVDVPGPKYRTGGQKERAITLPRGGEIRLTSERVERGTAERLSVEPPGIHEYARGDDEILLDDGMTALKVKEIRGADVVCEVIVSSKEITEGRGVAIRRRMPDLPQLDKRGEMGLEFAAKRGADFVALSNVRTADDVVYARRRLGAYGDPDPFIISKIETFRAVENENFDDILEASQGIMVARGDLAVSIDLESVPIMQEMMIAKCIRVGKPVITATQMLQSMEQSPMPTRAEATDVSNAVREGTDAVMLSGETAVGRHAVSATETMRNLAMRRERDMDDRRRREAGGREGRIQATLDYFRMFEEGSSGQDLEAQVDNEVSYRVAQMANTLGARGIVAFTESGKTARFVSRYKPIAPILALTPNEKTQRRLTVSWSVTPALVGKINDDETLRRVAKRRAVDAGLVPPTGGENRRIALTYGTPFGVSGSTNGAQVLEVEPRGEEEED